MELADIIQLLGGLAFFLFGMSLLGEGLKRVAGSKLEIILEKLTSSTWKGVILGTVVTAVIQSSSATTVMVVGFVNSGIMKLANAIGIIMGANIGTTATGWILVLAGVDGGGLLSSSTMFALVSFIGIILYFFCKSTKKNNIGMIMLAFGVLMSGMQTMSGAMEPLKTSPVFLDFIAAVSNSLLAMLVGILVTAVIQSCSASVGILQALSITGVIGYDVALPMVIGMCIGACAPVLLSALSANVNGKRTAVVYLIFNLCGAVILMVPFYIIHAFVGFEFMGQTANSMGIAILNTIFKVAATILLMPFAGLLNKLVIWLIPDKSLQEESLEDNLLDPLLLPYPPLALEQCRRAMEIMSSTAYKNICTAIELMTDYAQEKFESVQKGEDLVDTLEDRVGDYLVKLNANKLGEKESTTSGMILTCLGNVERISDHAVNIAELAQELYEKKIEFSSVARQELDRCLEAAKEIAILTLQPENGEDPTLTHKITALEEIMDILTKELKAGHIQRVQSGQCTLELGFVFNDLLNNLERVSDHCANIAIAVEEAKDRTVNAHDYMSSLNRKARLEYQTQLQSYLKKYYHPIGEER